MIPSEHRRVFVTGGTGFIGSHLVDLLLARGYTVSALVRKESAKSLPPEVHPVIGDLGATQSYAKALEDQDLLCHLGAQYKLGPVRRSEMYAANVDGTRKIIDTALERGVKHIVHMSSTAALGETFGKEPNESHAHNGVFRSYYEQTKHIAHGIALSRIASGAPLSIAIPGGVFGPRDKGIVAQTMRAFAAGKLPMQVTTASRFNLCHVDAVCEGLFRICTQATIGETWLLTGINISMPELFDELALHYNMAPPRSVSARRLQPVAGAMDWVSQRLGVAMPLSREALAVMDGSTYTYDSAKARTTLQWQAGNFRQALADYLNSAEMSVSA